MKENMLALVGGGIGDVLRATPALKAMGRMFKLDLMVSGLGYKLIRNCDNVFEITKWERVMVEGKDSFDYSVYDKIVFMEHIPWMPEWNDYIKSLPNFYDFKFSRDTTGPMVEPVKNEVLVQFEIAEHFGWDTKDGIPLMHCEFDDWFNCDEYDYVFCCGKGKFVRGSNMGDGLRRNFKDWQALADSLPCKIAVIGNDDVRLDGCYNFGEMLDILEVAELLRKAKFVISDDCGLAHMAAALGTPVLTFFGPTTPVKDLPWSDNSYAMVKKECPYLKGKDLYTHPCLTSIHNRKCPDNSCLDFKIEDIIKYIRKCQEEEKSEK